MAPSAKSTTEGEKRPKRASGWLGGLFQGRGKDGKVPIKADLGNKLRMYYNEELGAWVEPGQEDKVRSALRPPPPPKGAITSVPDHSTAADADVGTPGRASSTEMSSSSSIASVAPPRASMNGSQGRNRSVRSRYAAMPGLGTSTTDTAATASSTVNHMPAAPPAGPKAFFVPAATPAAPESDAQKEGLAPMYASNGALEHVNGEAEPQHQLQDGKEEVEELAEAPTFSTAGFLAASGAMPGDPEDGSPHGMAGAVDERPAWGLEEPGMPGLEQSGLEMEGGLEAAAEKQLGLEAAPGLAEEALPGDAEATHGERVGFEHDMMGEQATLGQAEGAAGWDTDPWELYFRANPDLHQQYLRSLQEICQGEGYEARWALLTQRWEQMVAAYPDIEVWTTERWYEVAAQDPQVAAYYQASSLLQIAQQQPEADAAAEASGGEAWGVSYDPYMNMVFNDAFHSQPQAMPNGDPKADEGGPRESGDALEEQPLPVWKGAAAEEAAGPDSASAEVEELEGVLQPSAAQPALKVEPEASRQESESEGWHRPSAVQPALQVELEASQQESESEVPFLEQDAREDGGVAGPGLFGVPHSPGAPADADVIAMEAKDAGDRVPPSPSSLQQPLELDDIKAKAEPVANGMVLTTDQIFSLGPSSLDDAGSEWAELGSDTESASGSTTPDAAHPAQDAPAASSPADMHMLGAAVHAQLLRPLERGEGASAGAAPDAGAEPAAMGRALAGGSCGAAPPSPWLASASEAMLEPSASAADDGGSVAAATIDSMSIVSSLPDDGLPPPPMPTASTGPSVPDVAGPQQLPGSWRLDLPEEQAMMPPTHGSPADAAMQLLHSMQETVRQVQAHTPQQAALLADLENRQQHVLCILQSMLSAHPAGLHLPSPAAGGDADADDAPAQPPTGGKGAMPSASGAGCSTGMQPPQEQVPEEVQEQSDIGTPLREHEGRRSQHLGYKSPCLPSQGSPVDSQTFAQLPDAPPSASSSRSAASGYRRRQLEDASQAVAGPSWAAPVQLTLNIIPEASGEAELEGALAELQQERQELCRRLEQRELEAAQAQAQACTLEAEIDSLREMAAAVEALRSELQEKDEEFNDLLTCLGQESAKVGALSAMLQEHGCDVEAVLAAVEDEYGWGDGDDGDGNGEPGEEQELEQEGGDAEAGPSGLEPMASWDNAVFEP